MPNIGPQQTVSSLAFNYTPDVSAERRTARATAAKLCRSMADALLVTPTPTEPVTIPISTEPREAALEAASLYQLANQLDPTTTPSSKWDKPRRRHHQ
ncbi:MULTISPECIES: hypothetical protein [unclassified Bifidobacterium]|uniref:hypothetical protein n=1 Tax=unclassified Bifidobacterium TaxID=2608897 RepID=UPI00112BE95A|nr:MULTISPECIES: hypothetical protein [unclassified Bifidobacterium]TPF79337.1 hypothetical protein BW08_10565 [Bifidobacterium sp. UTCIF-24]TPF84348.1 hypothetical protein BW07_05120 [Bifidobacterium sp. UTCIF-36]TPF91035.1 hypothetical protein BW10_02115 [Bifidobacterium sp. UTBIF-56]